MIGRRATTPRLIRFGVGRIATNDSKRGSNDDASSHSRGLPSGLRDAVQSEDTKIQKTQTVVCLGGAESVNADWKTFNGETTRVWTSQKTRIRLN